MLTAGVISSALYALMLAWVPSGWVGYSSVTQTVSELSAIGAPTRASWQALARLWTVLYVAFGWGVWGSGARLSAKERVILRVVGGTIIFCGLFGLFWPPMHLREVVASGGATLTDTLHNVWTAVHVVGTLLAMGWAAHLPSPRLRFYCIATMLTLVVSGTLTALQAPNVDLNLPTPSIGVWERINIVAWLVWVVVLALWLGAQERRAQGTGPAPCAQR